MIALEPRQNDHIRWLITESDYRLKDCEIRLTGENHNIFVTIIDKKNGSSLHVTSFISLKTACTIAILHGVLKGRNFCRTLYILHLT